MPMSDQQVAETGLSIEQNSATDKPQASAVSSKDKSGCWPVLAIPQLPSHPQHHADHDSRLQASSPETLRAMSRAPSIVPYPSSLGMMRGPPIAPSIPAALRIFLASRARDQGLTSRASSSTASKKITSVSTKASGGGAENNWHVDAATAGSAEPVENASRPSSRDVAGGSPVSNMEKHCWKSEWYRAGKPMNLVNFVRMKRAEMRRDGDEGKAKGRASNQSAINKEVEPQNTEIPAESKENKLVINCKRCLQKEVRCDRQKPCHQCQTHQEDCEYDAPADRKQEHSRAEEQSNVSYTRRRQSLSTIDTDNTKVLKNATKRKPETAAAPPTGRRTSNAAKGSNKPPDMLIVSTPDHSGDRKSVV